MPNSRFGYSVKKNSFKGLNIDCVQYSNIIRITYYSYSYSGTILNPNIIRIRIRPNICAQILFIFVFAHSEKTNIIRIRIRSKFWFRILFVFVFGPKNSICSPLIHSPVDEEVLAGEMLEVIVDCKSATYSFSMNVSTPSKHSTHVQLVA